MRRRLVAAFVGLATAVILLFGIPRGIVLTQLVESERQALVDRSAEVAALVAADATDDGDEVTPEVVGGMLGDGEVLELRPTDGTSVVVPAGAAPPSAGDLSATRPVPGFGEVVVTYPEDRLRDDTVRTLAPLALLALLLVALSGLAGLLLARRLARPFTELAGVAESLGRGHLDADVPHYAMPEADAIARALEDSSHRLSRMTRREREVIDYASHDLRTPITALRLTLEDLSLWPATPPEVAQELSRIVREVDRFSDAVSTLVDTPGSGESSELVDVDLLVREAARRLTPGGGRAHVRPVAGTPVLARLQPAVARKAVELLLEHAASVSADGAEARVVDGNGYVTVSVHGSPDHSPGHSPDDSSGSATSGRSVVWDQAVGLAGQLGGRLTGPASTDGSGAWTLILPKGASWPDG